jgi:hypothetical protein
MTLVNIVSKKMRKKLKRAKRSLELGVKLKRKKNKKKLRHFPAEIQTIGRPFRA